MAKELKRYTGSYHTRNGNDISIFFELPPYPNANQILNITSLHGEKKIVEKSIGLSLEQVKELKDILDKVISSSNSIINKRQ